MDDDDAFLYGDSADVKEEPRVSQAPEGKDGKMHSRLCLTTVSNGGVSSSMAA